jgi:predicted glycosyltransferase
MRSTIEITDEITPTSTTAAKPLAVQKKIWIDLDNSPHVPFFVPIIPELQARGFEVFLTARDSYQVVELLKFYGIQARIIGKHYGKLKILKFLGTAWRAVSLAYAVRKENIDLSVSHGSRGCMLASALLGKETIAIIDYEHTSKVSVSRMKLWVIHPEIIPLDYSSVDGKRYLKYPGIKEDVYLPSFHPDPQLRSRLGIAPDELLVTVRPPATEAHYHNPEAEGLLTATLKKFSKMQGARVLLLPRNKNQEKELRAAWPSEIASGKIVIPAHVEDGMNLIWNSDLVVSGGGTMNREAAAMGVPVYSIFRGAIGAVDRFLESQGRLVLLENVEQVQTKIRAVRRDKEVISLSHQKSPALETILQHISNIAESKNGLVEKDRK